MRALIQRVKHASVRVDNETIGSINAGLLILVGASKTDTSSDVDYLVSKLTNLRIFRNNEGKMDLSALDVGAELLIVSQFTLYGDTRKGRRPNFTQAMAPEAAKALYEAFVTRAAATGLKVETGSFGAMMDVELVNDGPVTLMIESPQK